MDLWKRWQQLPTQRKLLAISLVFAVLAAMLPMLMPFTVSRLRDLFYGNKLSLQSQLDTVFVPDSFSKLEIPQRQPPFFILKPVSASKYGIHPRQVFSLVAKNPVSIEFIKKALQSSVPFAIAAESDTEFKLTPVAPVDLDQIVTIALAVKDTTDNGHTFDRNYGWSYQTQGRFRITSVLPGNQKTQVPLNTGIEFVFSQDDYQDPASLISVTPSFQYHTERHGETYAVVPLQPFAPHAIYTVTLKKGLDLTSRRDPLSDDYSFSFQTQDVPENKPQYSFSLRESFLQVTPQEPPTVKVYTSNNWPVDKTAKTQIYKFHSVQQFIDSRKEIDAADSYWYDYYPEKPIDTSTLTQIARADVKLQKKENVEFFQLPEPLPPGPYLVRFWVDEKNYEDVWLQSTNTSAYLSVGRTQTLVWANSMADGSALNRASVRVVGYVGIYYTSDTGVAVFPTPSLFHGKTSQYMEVTSSDGEAVVLPARALAGYETNTEETANDYWTYLYHERNLYKPTDTVYFWGVVKHRASGRSPVALTVSLTKGYAEQEAVIVSQDVPVAADSSFFGSLSYTDIPQGWYSLNAGSDRLIFVSTGFQVMEYQKPEIKIDAIADRRAMFSGESAVFTARASFFDGTPAKSITLRVHEDHNYRQTDLVTNEAGEITYTMNTIYNKEQHYPRYEGVTITPALAEQGQVEGNASVYVYGSRLMLTPEDHQDGDRATAKATVNVVDLTRVNAGISSETKGYPAPGTNVELTVTKLWYEQRQIGTYYDFIEKVTRPKYDYVRHEETADRQRLIADARGKVEYSFSMERARSYVVVLQVTDAEGHTATSRQYFYYYEGRAHTEPTQNTIPELKLDRQENYYSLGEQVKVTIELNGKPYQGTDQTRYLFISAHRGRQDFSAETEPKLEFAFAPKHIPNVSIGAIVFTGSHYQPVFGGCSWDWYCYYDYSGYYFSGLQVRYRKEDSKLDLEVEADKIRYSPGATANISVTVTHKGKRQTDTEVNLVLVDQALAAIGGVIAPSVLDSLYKAVPEQIYYSYYTHRSLLPDQPQAEKGGGGGEYRQVFKDTSFFGRALTDSNGVATFSFVLPDNLTTWIVYGQSVTVDLKAGQTESKVVVSKDFFVTSQFPRQYLAADRPILSASGYGNMLKVADRVAFSASIFKDEEEQFKQEKVTSGMKEIGFDFPVLNHGTYRVGLKGTFGSLDDGVLYPFTVIDSRVSFEVAKQYRLHKNDEIKKLELGVFQTDRPVTLIITDAGKGQHYSSLYRFCDRSSNRLEKRITALRAAQVLKDRFDDKGCVPQETDKDKFQDFDGGLSQVWWGGSSLETTVWTVFVDPSGFDTTRLIEYLDNKSLEPESGTIQRLYALWGLTMLGHPRLIQIQNIADNAVTYEEKMIAALALASSGNTERARELYYDILADYAYTLKPYIRIQRGGDEDKDMYLKDTAHALLLGSMVLRDYDAGMYAYLRDYRYEAVDVVLDLSAIAFIDEEMARLPDEDTRVSVRTFRTQKIINLSKGGASTISLTSSELATLNLKVTAGKADVDAHYFVDAQALAGMGQDKRLILRRTYRKVTGIGNEIRPGDIVQVTLDFGFDDNAPRGSYRIIDYLPSGLTYLASADNYGLVATHWASAINNIVTTYVYHYPRWREYYKPVVYYARAAAAGTYVAEPTVFQSELDLSVYQAVSPETIRIEIDR